jgi:tetratricopeptide (TPR) repeat protein
MLHRTSMRSAIAAAVFAALFGSTGIALAAPADDLKEAQKLYAGGKVQPAMDKVDAVLKAMPKDPQARFLKGLLLTEQKNHPEAIQVFTGLTEDYPELPEPYNNLAVLYASQGNYDKAKAAPEPAIYTHPSYATAHENLGDVYAQLASRAYDRALQLDKNNTAAQAKLAMVKDLFSAQKGATGKAPAAAPKTDAAPKPDPARMAAAKAELAKPEPAKVASAPRTETPKTEPAKPAAAPKTEPPKVEPAKVEPPKVAAAEPKAAPPKAAEPAKAAPAAASGDDKAKITAAVEAWAKAWSAKDVKGYLASYAPEFEVPGGESRANWEKTRTERIERPKSIEVAVKVTSVEVDGNKAKVVIRQNYKSDTLKNNTTKTLGMVRSGDRWLIAQERVGG